MCSIPSTPILYVLIIFQYSFALGSLRTNFSYLCLTSYFIYLIKEKFGILSTLCLFRTVYVSMLGKISLALTDF